MSNVDYSIVNKIKEDAEINAIEAFTNNKRYGIKNGALMEFDIMGNAVLRTLEETDRGMRWNKRSGMVFAPFYYNVVFITVSEAKQFEKEARENFKKNNLNKGS